MRFVPSKPVFPGLGYAIAVTGLAIVPGALGGARLPNSGQVLPGPWVAASAEVGTRMEVGRHGTATAVPPRRGSETDAE